MAMKRNTQRIIAGLLVFVMVATVLAGVFAGGGDSSPAPSTSTGDTF